MGELLSDTIKIAGATLCGALLLAYAVASPHDGQNAFDFQNLIFRSVHGAKKAPEDVEQDEVVIPKGPGGNYFTDVEISGQTLRMIVDTGATKVVLSAKQAQRIGISPNPSAFRYQSQTANGVASFAKVTLPYIRVGSITLSDVDALVGAPGSVGHFGLLGMTFLGRLRSYRVASGELLLRN